MNGYQPKRDAPTTLKAKAPTTGLPKGGSARRKDPALTKEQLTSRLRSMEEETIRLQNEIVRLDGEKYEIERRAKAEGYQEAIREVMRLMREMGARVLIPTEENS